MTQLSHHSCNHVIKNSQNHIRKEPGPLMQKTREEGKNHLEFGTFVLKLSQILDGSHGF
jgi:hypothetical protein